MKKDAVRGYLALGAVLVVYNVVVFVAPFPKTGVFYVSWAFTLLAIAAQVYTIQTAFRRGADAKSKFYGFPIAKLGAMYLAAQLALGLVFMALGKVALLWIPLVMYVVLLGTAVVGFVAVDTVRDEITRQDTALAKNVSHMRAMQSKAISIATQAKDPETAAALQKLAESLRYSDPVSSAPLRDIEADLSACLDEIQSALIDGDDPSALTLCQKAGTILTERNRLCKLHKSST